jgi:hypothetical protein
MQFAYRMYIYMFLMVVQQQFLPYGIVMQRQCAFYNVQAEF